MAQMKFEPESIAVLLSPRFGVSSITGEQDIAWLTDQLNKLMVLSSTSEPPAPSEPQASEQVTSVNSDIALAHSSFIKPQPESVSNEPMMTVAQRNYQAAYIAATMANQPESVSAQGNKQVFMCGCISYNTALVPRCPIHKQASEPRQCIWSDAND